MSRALILALVWSASAFAATDSGTISCKTQSPLPKNSFQAILTLEARAVRVDSKDPKQQEIILRDVKMTVADSESKEAEAGRAKTLTGKMNPRATKYKDFYQTSMDALVDVKNFGQFQPIDECFFTVNLPTNLWNKSKFEAPVVTHCDQNGGTQGLECSFTPGK